MATANLGKNLIQGVGSAVITSTLTGANLQDSLSTALGKLPAGPPHRRADRADQRTETFRTTYSWKDAQKKAA